ncbi:hypothetical protein AWH49_18220 [Domibacillus aminovorans]|uniref:Uncharacterized protein n=1 Tax=Domibacillus aminovorans TaxID=29332 RepID=A0A177L2G2_9BACI|nr:hypothetical protein AWH49_18220 [Domibacillus aminovorans]
MESDLYFYTNMVRNILITFFQHGVWVVGFFYFLNKTFENKQLMKVSKIAIAVALFLFLFYSVVTNI